MNATTPTRRAAARSTTDFDKALGTRIRIRRSGKKISQEQLGRALDVTFQQVQKYERGSNRICAGRLFDIARALDCSVMDLLDGLDDAPAMAAGEQNAVEAFILSPQGIQMAQACEGLTPAQFKAILGAARACQQAGGRG